MSGFSLPEHAERTISDLRSRITELECELDQKKKAVNILCSAYGVPPEYSDSEPSLSSTSPKTKVVHATSGGRPDRYFGRPFARVVRQILETRNDLDIGPATAEDIYLEMVAGGFNFEEKSEENSKRALAVSLTKNSSTFRRLPNDMWGLAEWYGPVKSSKARTSASVPSAAKDDEGFDFAAKESIANAELVEES